MSLPNYTMIEFLIEHGLNDKSCEISLSIDNKNYKLSIDNNGISNTLIFFINNENVLTLNDSNLSLLDFIETDSKGNQMPNSIQKFIKTFEKLLSMKVFV